MVHISPTLLKTVQISPKWLKIVQNVKCSLMVKYGPIFSKLSYLVQDGPRWFLMVQVGMKAGTPCETAGLRAEPSLSQKGDPLTAGSVD